jgi:hypothetical protein
MQAAWETQFDKMATWLDNLQWDLPATNSLQKQIDTYKTQKSISGRNAIGLDMKIDTNWVQEYAAR